MPWMSAPIFTSMRARSWTWGSQAALPITVVPGISAAAISAFSVAITDGSSMNTSQGSRPRGALRTISRPVSALAPIARNASRCGSRRRRPITSPPGGGITARWKRASSGPASRNEARISSASSRSISTSWTSAAQSATSLGPRQATVDADRVEDLEHRVDVADARHVAHEDLLLGEDARGEDRQGAVLVAGRNHRAGQRRAAFDDELLHELSAPASARRSGPLDRRSKSVTAISPVGVRGAGRRAPASSAGRFTPRPVSHPAEPPRCNAALQVEASENRLCDAVFQRAAPRRTYVRRGSVRSPP